MQYCSIAVIAECVYNTVFQYLNYVYHYDCHIFSMQHTYIVLYCMPNFTFTLIFNTLDIEVHYDCLVFTAQRVYSGQKFLTYHTVSYRIHPWTLRKDRCGFMHTCPISVHKRLSCAVLLTAPIKVPMMRCCVELPSRYCALLCAIVRCRALLCITLKISWK